MKSITLSKRLLGIILSLLVFASFSQAQKIDKINPTNWYVGMKNPDLQVLIYGNKIANHNLSLLPYSGVKLKKVQKAENPNYLFADLEISKLAKPGTLKFKIGQTIFNYELKKRSAKPQPIDQSDFIYLIMPDRFANGDYTNDSYSDMADPNHDRKNPFYRHGGDLQGIINHLDYVKDLGVTAIWLTPVIENNQYLTDEGGVMRSAYHGYGFTDHYNIDKRLGGNEKYKELVDKAHAKGIKIIHDAVYNHVGINHWFLKDLPMNNWLNQWEKYTNTTYKDQPVYDIHASDIDQKEMLNGWFTSFLPDLNHKNPFVANFLIQHALWLVENFGIDGWRIDTYMYNDESFMNKCNKALLDEYPQMHIFGESAVNNAVAQSYFVKNNLNVPFKSNLPGTLDFVVEEAILEALNHEYGWHSGVNRLYTVLAQDLVYADPTKNVLFLENHDHHRFLSLVGEDFDKFKLGITWLLTLRGIPQFYYGSEILMKNFKDPSDAEVRRDFPGGWKEDTLNKFLSENRTVNENLAFNFIKNLADFRKSSDAIKNGKFIQYVPQNGIYVYFRKSAKQTIMVVSNPEKTSKEVELSRYAQSIGNNTSAFDIINQKAIIGLKSISVPPKTALVLELRN
jgi:glycosidase